jgi:hypothetical protein
VDPKPHVSFPLFPRAATSFTFETKATTASSAAARCHRHSVPRPTTHRPGFQASAAWPPPSSLEPLPGCHPGLQVPSTQAPSTPSNHRLADAFKPSSDTYTLSPSTYKPLPSTTPGALPGHPVPLSHRLTLHPAVTHRPPPAGHQGSKSAIFLKEMRN